MVRSLTSKNFIRNIIRDEIRKDRDVVVHTRFPPYPNGYLHIGHAKSICLNFGIAEDYRGKCNLRIDNTNPMDQKTLKKYVRAIKEDISWLGFSWNGKIRYASDYQETFYRYAVELIQKKLAYVDHLDHSSIKRYRGDFKHSGRNSPYRNRTVEENLNLFEEMKCGLFEEGEVCLRAKIDMNSSSMILRDPVLYRIKGTYDSPISKDKKFRIYPTYDFAHCISDAIEGITHSLCTLEFQENRILYDWILDNISISHRPRQYEFSSLNLEYTVMSKTKISILVERKMVESWRDPRLPTISGLRRRGYTAKSIRSFCQKIGVTRQNSTIRMQVLESCIRKDLNKVSPRMMGVLNPIKLIIENMGDNEEYDLDVFKHPQDRKFGKKSLKFNNKLYVDRFDFFEGRNVELSNSILGEKFRLRHACTITIDRICKDRGKIIIYCHCEKESFGRFSSRSNRVKKIIHWVSATYGVRAEFRMFDHLFKVPNPGENFLELINENSMILKMGFVEPEILSFKKGQHFQLEREGYFCIDADSNYVKNLKLTINHIVSLK